MFVLFLNPRPQFRVKEHSDSVLPPLSPSAKHKNQNLHTYVTLILDLGGTGCQYSRESRADRPSHPPLLWAAAVPFGEPGGPEQAGAAPRERRRHNPPFSEGRQRPLGGAHSIPKAGHPGVSNSSPRERESWTRRGFPAGCGAPGTPVLLPGHLCAAHTRRGAPERHSRSVSSQPPRNANGRATDLFPYRLVASSPILRILPAPLQASTPVPQRPGAENQPDTRPPGLSASRRPLPPPNSVPARLGGTHS